MLSKNDVDEVEREYCKRSLAGFAKRAWHILEPATQLKWGWAVESICEHLEAVSRGEIRRLLMNVPPGTMKSLLTSVIWPAWEWGALSVPEKRFLSTAHKQDLAVRDSTKCRRLITSDWYQNLWPLKLTGDQNAKTKFENERTGFREAMAFGSMTGARGDRVILDDPHSVDDANSRAKLNSDIVTFREALPSRVNNDESAIVIIMQRLAVGDVSDVAIELGYDHLLIPMRYEENRSKHAVGVGDPRTEDRELMFADRFSEAAVSELEASLGSHACAGQLQQRPIQRGGRIIKQEWFGTYDVLPKMKKRMIIADTAATDGRNSDWSVIGTFGLGVDNKLYLLDITRKKLVFHKLVALANEILEREALRDTEHFGVKIEFHIEHASSGIQLLQELKRTYNNVVIKKITRGNDNKRVRLENILVHIEGGALVLPSQAHWLDSFVGECLAFTGLVSGEVDDQVDVLIDALSLTYQKPKIVWK